MDEQAYLKLADVTFKRIEDLLEDVDAEDVDFERAGDVLTLAFKNGKKCVVNTQRPTRQIWMAAGVRAWHFDWDGSNWIDAKEKSHELMATLKDVVREQSGVAL